MVNGMLELRTAPAGDSAVAAFLEERGMAIVARRGELVDALTRPAVTAVEDGDLVGVLSYDLGRVECEILTLFAARQWTGVGSALLEAVTDLAASRADPTPVHCRAAKRVRISHSTRPRS